MIYSHTQTPNRTSCVYHDINQDGRGTITLIAASSNHPGGVNLLLMDGSVRFVKSVVNYRPWYALATPNGAERSVLTLTEITLKIEPASSNHASMRARFSWGWVAPLWHDRSFPEFAKAGDLGFKPGCEASRTCRHNTCSNAWSSAAFSNYGICDTPRFRT